MTEVNDAVSNLKYQTRTWHAYNDVLQLISSGDLAPGSRLDEQRLAENLGISRTPLREAITQLVSDGIIENRPYRGNFVRSFTAKQVYDLYEVRKVLEAKAVRLAIPHLSEPAVAKLRSILIGIKGALDAGDLELYGMADREFHETIADLTGNETLIAMLNRLAGQIQLIRTMANRNAMVVEVAAAERLEILDAMERQDVEEAARLMEDHIDMVQQYIVRLIDSAMVDEQRNAMEAADAGD